MRCLLQILLVIMLLFAYGVYYNSRISSEESLKEGQIYSVSFVSGEEAASENAAKLKELLPALIEDYESDLELCLVNGSVWNEGEEEIHIRCRLRTENGKLISAGDMPDYTVTGSVLRDEDEQNGSRVCVLSADFGLSESDSIVLGGESYLVVGTENPESNDFDRMSYFGLQRVAYVPFMGIPETTELRSVTIRLDRVLTAGEIKRMNSLLRNAFGNQIISYPEGIRVDYDEQAAMKTIMLAAVLLSLMAAYCMSRSFTCQLELKKREHSILLLLGAGKGRIWLKYAVEFGGQLILSELVGYCIFRYLLLRRLNADYKWMWYIFTEETGGLLQVAAVANGIVLLFVFLSLWNQLKKTPIELARG